MGAQEVNCTFDQACPGSGRVTQACDINTPSTEGHKKSKYSQFGTTVMMVLLAFPKVIIYSDGHSLER